VGDFSVEISGVRSLVLGVFGESEAGGTSLLGHFVKALPISVDPRSATMLLRRPIATTQTNHSKDINIFKTLNYTCDQGIM
jgi:hypothetical protein